MAKMHITIILKLKSKFKCYEEYITNIILTVILYLITYLISLRIVVVVGLILIGLMVIRVILVTRRTRRKIDCCWLKTPVPHGLTH